MSSRPKRYADLTPGERLSSLAGTLNGIPRTLALVWAASPTFTIALTALNVARGLQPVGQAWLSKLVIDAIGAGLSGGAPPDASWTDPFIPLAETLGYGAVLLAPYALGLLCWWGALTLVSALLDPTITVVQMQLGDRLTREMQTRIIVKANSFADVSYFENPSYYDALQRAANDASYRPINVLAGIVGMFRTVVHLLGMLGVLLAFQPLLVLFAFALAVPNLLSQFRSHVEIWAIQNWSVPEVRKMTYFVEVLTSPNPAKEVRLFGLERHFRERFLREFNAFRTRLYQARLRHCRWELGVGATTAAGNSLMFGYLLARVLSRQISLGDFTLLTQAVWQVHDQVAQLVRQISSLYSDILFVGQLFVFLDAPVVMPVPEATTAAPAPSRLQRGIELRHVTFKYPGTERAVLDDLSLSIAPGESVALVGANGAGKTTLVKLLTRLYDPTEGQILIDGVDLREMDLEGWRRRSAAIFQDFSRFHLPARQNVGIGNLTHLDNMDVVRAAAERGGAMPLVERLPEKWDTVLGRWMAAWGTEGAELSGGEWQKVALSRAFMRHSDDLNNTAAHLLILDEPTASLDTQSEYDVYLRFSELTAAKATLLISHRFSTVKMADRIVVIENGRIVEQGTHADLITLNGTYADLYEKQASRYRDIPLAAAAGE